MAFQLWKDFLQGSLGDFTVEKISLVIITCTCQALSTFMVNYTCQLDWSMPYIWLKITSECVSVRMLLEKISIWLGRLSRAVSTPCGWASSNPLRAWAEHKRGGRENSLSLTTWDETSVFCLQTGTSTETASSHSAGSQALGLGLETILQRFLRWQQSAGILSLHHLTSNSSS